MSKRFFDKHARVAKPRASELDRRNRESGLNQALRTYTQDPDNPALSSVWASLEDTPTIEAYVDGIRYSVAMSAAVDPSTPPGPITFIAATGGSGATNPSANVPSGTTSGDTMLAFLSANGSNIATAAPAGWGLIRRQDFSATDISLVCYGRTAGASEPASYTWTQSGEGAIVILTYRNVNAGFPVNVQNGTINAFGATHTAPTATTDIANAMVIRAFAAKTGTLNSASISPPSGHTERGEAYRTSGSVNGHTVEASDLLQAAAGATGTATLASVSESVISCAMTIALAPAA